MKKLPLFLLLTLTTGCSMSTATTDDIAKKAVSLRDSAICQAIVNGKVKQFCESAVLDSKVMDIALSSGDVSQCKQIKSTEYQKACELGATSEQRKRETMAKDLENLYTLQAGTSLEKCSEVSDPGAQYQCRVNVAITLAYTKKDPSGCKFIKETTLKQSCDNAAK